MPRSYRHIQEYEKEILEQRKQGLTLQQIADKLGFNRVQLKNFINRYNKKQRKIAAGIAIKKKGRSYKEDKYSIETDMEKSNKKLKKERDTAVQERDELKAEFAAVSSELAVYKRKEEEKGLFSRKQLNANAKRISKEDQLTRSLRKALAVIDAHGLRYEYEHIKLNAAQKKSVLE